MIKTIIIITFLAVMTSCFNEPVDYNPLNNNSKALDSLKKYDDFLLGDFNGKFIVTTTSFTKNYSASMLSNPVDSSFIQFSIGYKLINSNVEKSVWVSYKLLESKIKLNLVNHKYNNFSDFINFFNRNNFDYYQSNQPKENIHTVCIKHQNYYEINNDVNRYSSDKYTEQITPNNFNFTVDSIKVLVNPVKKVQVYYSFKCIGVNNYSDTFIMKNGKGKSTFDWQ